jgi:hypothetical protein
VVRFVIIQFTELHEVQQLNYALHKCNIIYPFYKNQSLYQDINYGIPEHCEKLNVFT